MPAAPKIINRVGVENLILDDEGFSVLIRTEDETGTSARYIKRLIPRQVMSPVLIEVVISFGTGDVVLDIPDSGGQPGGKVTFDGATPNSVVQAAVTAACRSVKAGY